MSEKKNQNLSLIRIGRIGKTLEEFMGIALANDVSIYLHEALANAFARDYPDSYLSLIEEISFMVKKPDGVSFDREQQELQFIRLFAKEGELFLLKVVVAHIGSPQKWIVRRVCAYRNLIEATEKGKIHYVRL